MDYQNNNWISSNILTFDDVTKSNNISEFGAGTNPGFILGENSWSDVEQKPYYAYSIYDYTTNTFSAAVTYNLDSVTANYSYFNLPAVTKDGEYFAHSCIIPTNTENLFNVALFVY